MQTDCITALCTGIKHCVYVVDKPDKLQKGWACRAGTWAVDSLTGRAGEVVSVGC